MGRIGGTKERIIAYLRERAEIGEHPSLREIAERVGLTVPTVREHLQGLEAAGTITRSRKARGIRMTKGVGLPVVGRIAAGLPMLAVEEGEEEIVCAPSAFGGGDIVALRVEGRSMTDAGIRDGDMAIVRRQPTVENGEIAAVLLDDECTLKRVIFDGRRVTLRPECKGFAPIRPRPEQTIRIYGKLVGVLRRTEKQSCAPSRTIVRPADSPSCSAPEREGLSSEQIRALRAMTMEDRLRTAQNLCITAREWTVCAIRSFHPDWSEEKIQKEARQRFLYGGSADMP